jgi:hypothetical protein
LWIDKNRLLSAIHQEIARIATTPKSAKIEKQETDCVWQKMLAFAVYSCYKMSSPQRPADCFQVGPAKLLFLKSSL